MRAKLIVVAVLAVGIVVIFIASLFMHHSAPKTTATNTCTQLIADIEKGSKGDAKTSYTLFSDNLKQQISYGDWQKQVPGLNAAFTGLTPTFEGETTITPATKTTPATVKRTYSINNVGVVYRIQCFLAPSNGGYMVDGFSMQQATQ